MILIAESGSTKCNWLLAGSDYTEIDRFDTIGINPYFYSSEEITREYRKSGDLMARAPEVREVYFYGAGCSSEYYRAIMENGLKPLFPEAKVVVDHDLTACAFACYDGSPAICCILGTGCNSCFFDGQSLQKGQPSLGYIVADEGSGNFFGKWLLKQYFYKKLPSAISTKLEEAHNMDFTEVTTSIYESERPNVYLAGFMPFIAENMENPFVRSALESGFREFVKVHVECFPDAQEFKVHFVGSVAYHLWPVLREVLSSSGLQPGNVISRPLDALMDYHMEYGYHRAG